MKLSKAEQELYYWQNGAAGDFMSLLFELICKADGENRHFLSLGYPDEVNIIYRFQNEKGYWENIQKEMRR